MTRASEFARPRVTLLAIPKPFVGHIGVIQRNALASWARLSPRPQILLFGDDAGVAEAAAEFGATHVSVARNEQGTPLLSDMFHQGRRHAEHDTIVYTNSDIMLFDDLLDAIARVRAEQLARFLIIGRRTDVNIYDVIDDTAPDWMAKLDAQVTTAGRLAAQVCKDYFVFRREQYAEMPEFAVGRANWDNWMVYHAHERQVPVIDVTECVRVIHQNHDYAHLPGGKSATYLNGTEAKRNKQLAGGSHLVSGSVADWRLTPAGLKRIDARWPIVPFLADAFSFGRLVLELVGLKRVDWREAPTVEHSAKS
ncbi:MAG: hypothetical protein JSS27_19765 [Planctomycetes bacterium]|nr:hypothetical protein [Planctomycetota bacterium]